ncbi:carboxypeptidase regulatory-like domain-containing protein [Terriglobus sp. TAA 43]|uniref:carboxypeptidase regulatory-like domain-containing protein n=1 Tax=Terriglobus sp. TAA 43 TaxID=278961 RepID=UPI0006909556|nr:carboxypeptidase regulatory-like domain-containing protein [Terriglobus sp. TAA 43]
MRLIAQVSTASVMGTVVDVTTARIADADVKLVNLLTGTENDSKTNRSGAFLMPGIIPGDYTLEIDREGFAAVQVTGITLHVGDTKNLLIRMRVGSVSQTVNVEQTGTSLDSGDISVGTVVDKEFVGNLPLNGRSFQDLIDMTPGTLTQSPQVTGQTFGGRGTFSVNGQQVDANGYTVDGVSANVGTGTLAGHQKFASDGSVAGLTALGTTQSLVAVDALQEFRVLTSTYSSEYGRSQAGQLVLLTRSGTSTPHGTLFNYVRTDALDANDWYTRFNHADRRTTYHQDDFGGTLGMPVSVPGMHRGTSKGFLFLSYEGLNVQQPSAPQVQFEPRLRLQGEAAGDLQPVLNLFPQGDYGTEYPSTDSTGLAPYAGGATSYPGIVNATSVRFDQASSFRFNGFFRYGETPSSSEAGSLSSLTRVHVDTRTLTAGFDAQLGARASNDLRVGYAASHASLATSLDNFSYSTSFHYGNSLNTLMGLPSSTDGSSADVFIQIPGAGPSEILTDHASGRLEQWNLRDTISAQVGGHLLRFGFDQRRVVSTIRPPALSVEADFFSTNALTRNLSSAMSITRNGTAKPVFEQFAAFVQDEWRIAKTFTVSSGLRWEIAPPPRGSDGNDAYTLLGDVNAPSTLSLASRGTPLWRTGKFNVAPHAGAVWSPIVTPGKELLLRGGMGVYFATPNQAAVESFSAMGFSETRHLSNVPVPITPAQLDFSTPSYGTAAVFAFPHHLQLPYALQWNVALEKSLGRSQTIDVSWVGTDGRRLLQKQLRNVQGQNPLLGEIYFFPGQVTSSYQALQIKFQRSLSKGLQVLASYGWSHTLDYGSTAPAFPLSRGNSDLDVRHNLQAAITWDPHFHPNARPGSTLFSGWAIDGRLSLRSAFPITPLGNIFSDSATGNRYYSGVDLLPRRSLYLYGGQYPGGRIINGGPNVTSPAFALPSGTAAGNAPRNQLRGFGASQVSLSVRRDFSLRTKLKLQFRVDGFNVFNHPQFGYIDPTLMDALFGQATLMLNQSFGSTGSLYESGGPRSLQIALRLHF